MAGLQSAKSDGNKSLLGSGEWWEDNRGGLCKGHLGDVGPWLFLHFRLFHEKLLLTYLRVGASSIGKPSRRLKKENTQNCSL